MRKLAFGLALVFAIGLIAVPAMAEEGEFTSDGDVRLRWDYFSNYVDARDDTSGAPIPPNGNDSYDAFPYRARLGVQGRFTDRAWGRAELQAAGWFGDQTWNQRYPWPTSTTAASTPSAGTVGVYQAYVTVEGGTFDFTAGRKEVVLGNELQIGDIDFYNGQAFDGIFINGDFSSWDLDLYYMQLNETFQNRGDAGLWGADAVINIGKTHIDPYLLLLKNHDQAATSAYLPGAEVWTFGINWEKPISEEKKGWDLSIELAGQMGDYNDLGGGAPAGSKTDAKGYILEGWFGWSFGNAGRVHIGYLLASGDDTTRDATTNELSENKAWVPLFTDPHAYNRLGNLDLFAGFGANAADPLNQGMSNISDVSLGYDWWGGERHHAMLAFHYLTRPEVGMYNVVAPATEVSDKIGTELDISYDYMYAKNSRLEIGVSTLFAGDFIESTLGSDNTDNITRVWAQLHLNWGK